MRHHGGKAPRERLAAEGRQNLRIDHRLRQHAETVQKDFKIFAARVQKLFHLRVAQQRNKRPPVADGQRIDQHQLFAVEQLNQSQLWIIGTGADEFGVERDGRMLAGLLADNGQLLILVDQGIIQISFSPRQTARGAPSHHQ